MRASSMEAPGTGKLIVGLIFLLAILTAGLALFYHRSLQRRPIEYWGPKDATLILHASEVEAYLLVPADEGDNPGLTIGPMAFDVVEKKRVERAPGFSHVRRSFLNHRAYDWNDRTAIGVHDVRYALKFTEGSQSLVVIVDQALQRVAAELRSPVSVAPIHDGMRDFFHEQFPPESE